MAKKKLELTIQPFSTEDDLHELYPVRRHPITPSETMPTEEDFISQWNVHRDEFSCWVVKNAQKTIVGYARLPLYDPFRGNITSPRMVPDHRHPDAIHLLLQALEDEAHRHRLESIHNGIPIPDDPSCKYFHQGFQNAGFNLWHYTWRMTLAPKDYVAPRCQITADIRSLDLQKDSHLTLIGTLGSLAFQNYPGFEDKTPITFRKLIEEQQKSWNFQLQCVVCYRDKQPIGFSIYFQEPATSEDSQEKEGWAHLLAVHPDNRGQGYGSALFAYMIEDLWEQGMTKIDLAVAGENESAVQLYRKAGFKDTMRLVHYKKRITAL